MKCPGCNYPIVYGGYCECKYMKNDCEWIELPDYHELWNTVIHYLFKCNKAGSDHHTLCVDVAPNKFVMYSITTTSETLIADQSLEKVAAWLKVYTSWEED